MKSLFLIQEETTAKKRKYAGKTGSLPYSIYSSINSLISKSISYDILRGFCSNIVNIPAFLLWLFLFILLGFFNSCFGRRDQEYNVSRVIAELSFRGSFRICAFARVADRMVVLLFQIPNNHQNSND